MKIVCDACQAKYSISDDKVRGKVFKIRCKKCSNVIVVRGVGDAAPEPAAPTHDDSGDAIWHLVIDQGQVGPMTIADVQRRLAAGEIDADTFAWREGLEDWAPLAQLDELAALVTRAGHAASDAGYTASDATTPRGALDLPSDDRGLFDMTGGGGDAPGAELFAASGASKSTRDDDGFFSSRNAPAEPAAAQRMRGERNESSVLFSLNNLAQIATPRAPAGTPAAGSSAAAAGVAGGEGSGLIDIRSMASAYLGGAGAATSKGAASASIGSIDDLPVFGTGGFSEPAVLVPIAARTSNSRLLYVMIAAVALLAIAAVVMVVMLMHSKPTQVASMSNAGSATATGISSSNDTMHANTSTSSTNAAATNAATSSNDAAHAITSTSSTDVAAAHTSTATSSTNVAHANTASSTTAAHANTASSNTASSTNAAHANTATNAAHASAATSSTSAAHANAATTTGKAGTNATTVAATNDATTGKAKANECDEVACLVNSEPLCCRHPTAHGDPNPPKKTVDTSLPERLAASDVTSSMGAVKARVMACGDRSPSKGTVKVHVKVGADGHVGNVSVDSSPDPALAACVVAAVKKASFPKTQTGGSFGIPYTF